ncbi:hypothetical protein NFI96_006142, partial [Prochilodus magdalenae]
LAGYKLTMNSCETICAALKSNSLLKELDLSYTDLQDSEINLLSAALKSSNCKLEVLRLPGCKLTMNSCETLSAALMSSNSLLKELDLSDSDLQDSGVNLLSAALRSSNCKLEILRLSGCMVTEEGCSYLASALSENPSLLKELYLSYNHPGDTGVTLLSARLEDPHCRLDILRKIPLGCKSSLVGHLVLFWRVLYMVLKDGVDTLDVTFKLRVDGFDYPVFVLSDTDMTGALGEDWSSRLCLTRQEEQGGRERRCW